MNSLLPDTAFLLGNEAIAKAALDIGVNFISCYPGTPSSEVVETLLKYEKTRDGNSQDPIIEYSINEKVALETACGYALSGSPSLVTMKHVGLNVAADPLFTASYIGMPGGLVILSADDPGCHSSQNEQDNRHYARAANLPCFEPISPQEAYDMLKAAFQLGQKLAQPVLLRTVTRINHARSKVISDASIKLNKTLHRPNGLDSVPVPMVARKRRQKMLEQMEKAAGEGEISRFNKIHFPSSNTSPVEFGIIASGMARAYMWDALKELKMENEFAIFELGMTWPLPKEKVKAFLKRCKNVLVLEEGENLLEKDISQLALGMEIKLSGKDEGLTQIGEFSTTSVKERLQRWLNRNSRKPTRIELPPLPTRAPNLCPGCAHRSVYYAARKVFGDEAVYSSDIGCYTLGVLPPLRTADFAICMGSSISAGAGYALGSPTPVIAFIGDSTFFHSGITGLANAVFNKRDLLVIILDNGTTAMTGHQPHPGMHQQVLGERATQLDIENICKGIGITELHKVKSHNLSALLQLLQDMKEKRGVRVIIAQEPCLLFAKSRLGKKGRPVAQVIHQCAAGEKCLKELGCPAFMRKDDKLAIDENSCGGCMVCVQIAPEAFQVKKSF